MKKRFLPISLAVLSLVIGLSSCKREAFVEANTNPGTLYNITPEEQFTNASIAMFDADFEYYYDYYRIMMPWLQYHTPQNGNSKTFMSEVGNFNQRYGYFYGRVGNVLTDVQELIERMPQEEQALRQHQWHIAQILKVYYAFYTMEINGSIPYTEAFQARYGGTLTPKYDTQEQLFGIFEQQLKQAATVLSSDAANQKTFANADLYYKGDATKWKKAANVLRLRIAMRLQKRKPDVLRTIALDVLSNPANVFSSNDDNLVLITGTPHAGVNSNWDPAPAIFRAPKALVDFMWETGDPRIRIFYQKNSYTQEHVDSAKRQNLLPATAVWNPRQYVGSFANPDSASDAGNIARYYTTRTIRKRNNAGVLANFTLDTLSRVQYRLFSPGVADANGQQGTGNTIFPLLTYAELCFYRAELAARGVTTESAATQYENGVKASMRMYDQFGNLAKVFDYVAITNAEIDAAYNHPKVKYDPAIGLQQIASQSYIHFFKQANEAWSLYKRTGMPNSSTVLQLERIMADGVEQRMPRRALLNAPKTTDLNYNNASAAQAEMAKDAGFGAGPTDIYGRVWWDMP